MYDSESNINRLVSTRAKQIVLGRSKRPQVLQNSKCVANETSQILVTGDLVILFAL